jgi:hypothetical protein
MKNQGLKIPTLIGTWLLERSVESSPHGRR